MLGPAQAGDIPQPTPEVLSKYFDERKVLFRAPEYRKVTLLTLTPADLAKPETVTDADAKSYYEQHKSSYRHAGKARTEADRIPERGGGRRPRRSGSRRA